MSTDFSNSLMQALATGNGNGISALIPQMLAARLGEDDPTVDLLSKYLAQRQAEQTKHESAVGTEDSEELRQYSAELEQAQRRSTATAEAVQELRERIEKVYAELETLRQRNDFLARAVGACCLCWGEDLQCPVCAGEGRPGFTMPDRELFTELIAPAVRQFLKRRRIRRPFSQTMDPRTSIGLESPKGEGR